jgi:hypothetical protein
LRRQLLQVSFDCVGEAGGVVEHRQVLRSRDDFGGAAGKVLF